MTEQTFQSDNVTENPLHRSTVALSTEPRREDMAKSTRHLESHHRSSLDEITDRMSPVTYRGNENNRPPGDINGPAFSRNPASIKHGNYRHDGESWFRRNPSSTWSSGGIFSTASLDSNIANPTRIPTASQNTLGSNCRQDEDCREPHSECRSGTCSCSDGFSLSSNSRHCLGKFLNSL